MVTERLFAVPSSGSFRFYLHLFPRPGNQRGFLAPYRDVFRDPMDDSVREYRALCSRHHFEPQACVEAELSRLPDLDFSRSTLTNDTCAVLGKWLQTTSRPAKINFSDCLLEPLSLKALMLGLKNNRSVHTLNLKGNNISGESVCHVAAMLRDNTALKRLSLEWNPIGEQPSNFEQLCDALAINHSLHYLDLRNCQLGHEHIPSLQNLLASNRTLVSLDLRWNRLGDQGGKVIHSVLSSRICRPLMRCDLAGNYVDSITVARINSLLKLADSGPAPTCTYDLDDLSRQLQARRHKVAAEADARQSQVEHLTMQLDIKRSELEGRNSSLMQLTVQNASLQAELKKLQQAKAAGDLRAQDLEQHLQEVQRTTASCRDDDQQKIKHLSKSLAECEHKRAEIDRKHSADAEQHETKRQQMQSRLSSAEEDVLSLQGQLQAARLQAQRTQEEERERYQKELRKMEADFHQREDRMKQKADEELNDMRLKMEQFREESQAASCEVLTLTAKFKAESTHSAAILAAERFKLKNETDQKCMELEQEIQAARRDTEEVRNQLKQAESATNSLKQEKLDLMRNNNDLTAQTQKLSADNKNLRSDVADITTRMRAEYRPLEDTVKTLEDTVRAKQSQVKELTRELESARTSLQQEREERDRVMEEADRHRRDDAQRIRQLKEILDNFFTSGR